MAISDLNLTTGFAAIWQNARMQSQAGPRHAASI